MLLRGDIFFFTALAIASNLPTLPFPIASLSRAPFRPFAALSSCCSFHSSAVDSTPNAFPWFRTPAAPPKDGRMNASRNAQPSNNTGVGSRGVSVQSSSNVPLSSSIVPGRKIGSLMLAPSHAEFYSVENCPLLMEVEEFEVPKLSDIADAASFATYPFSPHIS
ncbi:hypothetical protein M430DRAFT_20175 [Amorphotheca resinae ATCC 22711]|uniref:Uncharacterized protein n=1 Tax=Amorphotheca resinae ATCC 22711 TaxID=857342 RepID=A0A2T3AXQ3_AMORE|nr:hypothetical protein M430DRAFT_20175 [Amorphotheca resinae ATCC 22711]PSS14856.1 hypothetical protein M430DRAFT_20175 [Amorphotheca resinae ATCC 22711]